MVSSSLNSEPSGKRLYSWVSWVLSVMKCSNWFCGSTRGPGMGPGHTSSRGAVVGSKPHEERMAAHLAPPFRYGRTKFIYGV
eukprot:3334554-Prymnesium_polylepis.1